jgi:hypothetical protein
VEQRHGHVKREGSKLQAVERKSLMAVVGTRISGKYSFAYFPYIILYLN